MTLGNQLFREEVSELLLEVLIVEIIITIFMLGWSQLNAHIGSPPKWIQTVIKYVGQRLVFRVVQSLVFRVAVRFGLYATIWGEI